MKAAVKVVYAYAKILILKQITTLFLCTFVFLSCICLCKDTNFKANHNKLWYDKDYDIVVYAYAKILILKQITTDGVKFANTIRCICLCKDTNFKANHNRLVLLTLLPTVVYAYAKILILKQITTKSSTIQRSYRLYMPMQRY